QRTDASDPILMRRGQMADVPVVPPVKRVYLNENGRRTAIDLHSIPQVLEGACPRGRPPSFWRGRVTPFVRRVGVSVGINNQHRTDDCSMLTVNQFARAG